MPPPYAAVDARMPPTLIWRDLVGRCAWLGNVDHALDIDWVRNHGAPCACVGRCTLYITALALHMLGVGRSTVHVMEEGEGSVLVPTDL